MDIWDASVRRVLHFLQSSTARKYYVSEIQEGTGMSRTTLCPLLKKLSARGVLHCEKERQNQDSANRAKRVYYTLKPELISAIRLSL
jgi:DNA-binding MarR family transcriptional regulator